MTNQRVPVLCDKCRLLALANFEDVPLCPRCLMATVGASEDPHAIDKITPLYISRQNVKGIIKSRHKAEGTPSPHREHSMRTKST